MSEKMDTANRARGRATSALAILTLLALLAVAPAAHATYNPIVSGTTKLTLDKGFLSLLRQNERQADRQGRRDPQGRSRHLPRLRRQVRPDHLQRLHRTRRRPLLQSRQPEGPAHLPAAENDPEARALLGQIRRRPAQGGLRRQARGDQRRLRRQGQGLDPEALRQGRHPPGQEAAPEGRLQGRPADRLHDDQGKPADRGGSGKRQGHASPSTPGPRRSCRASSSPSTRSSRPNTPAPSRCRSSPARSPPTPPKGRSRPWGRSNWCRSAAARSSCAKPGPNSPPGSTRSNSSSTPHRPTRASRDGSAVGALSLAAASVVSDPKARTIGVTNAAVAMGANLHRPSTKPSPNRWGSRTPSPPATRSGACRSWRWGSRGHPIERDDFAPARLRSPSTSSSSGNSTSP